MTADRPTDSDEPPPALEHDAFGRLVLTFPDGRRHVGVLPVRGFPFSSPSRWISFCDEQGHEVYCLADINRLPADARAVLEADLARREFVPQILRVREVSGGAEPTEWHVETDRGPTRFLLTSEDHIRRMGHDGALIVDSHGIRYRIPRLAALDSHSRRLLKRYL